MEDCLFCKIINREIPSTIVYEDEEILAFKDINPIAPVHILVIPKKHYNDISEVPENEAEIIAKIHMAINKIAKEQGIADKGYRIINNCKEDGGQEVKHEVFEDEENYRQRNCGSAELLCKYKRKRCGRAAQ